jgi:hypothetical protein
MKRFLAIFSLVVMMIAAVKPVFAMHYCGNKFSSLQIYNTTGIGDSCCDDKVNHDVAISDNLCCETEMMKLSTDEFQTKTIQQDVRILPPSFDLLGYTQFDKMSSSKLDSNRLLYSFKFPSKGLQFDDVGILTYICIYRI